MALWDTETESIMGTMKVTEKYAIDKEYECKQIFRTTDPDHPGVQKVMEQGAVNLAGPVKVLSESYYPEMFAGIYQRPAEARKLFAERGWTTVAALQLRNPMHNSHAYLAWIAIEVCDGVYIHQLVGKLKPGDIPAEVRVKAIDALVNKYFRKDRVIQGGYPMEMRYAGPREALLHALFRQNYGCTHLIVGRDHAGVGDYYGPFDAQKIFSEIPPDALLLQPLCMDWTFYCYECGTMASMKTCPHNSKAVIDENGKYKGGARLLLSGTLLRKLMSEGKPVPAEFSKPEVIAVSEGVLRRPGREGRSEAARSRHGELSQQVSERAPAPGLHLARAGPPAPSGPEVRIHETAYGGGTGARVCSYQETGGHPEAAAGRPLPR